MAKIRFTVSIDDSTNDLIKSYKQEHGVESTSQAIEDLVILGVDSIKAQPDTLGGNVMRVIQIADRLKELIRVKNAGY